MDTEISITKEENTVIKLSERVRGLAPSATMAAAQRAREMRAKGINVISFTVGEPDFDTPDNIRKAAVDAKQRRRKVRAPLSHGDG